MGTMRPANEYGSARRANLAGRGARAGQDDLPKRKPDLKKLWPQIKSLVKPRLGCCWPAWG